MKKAWLLLSLSLWLLVGCSPSQQVEQQAAVKEQGMQYSEEDVVDFDQMFDVLRKKGELLVVYGDQGQYTEEYKKLALSIAGNFQRIKVEVKPSSEVDSTIAASVPVFLLGSPQANPTIVELLKNSPVTFGQQGFEFNKKQYQKPSHLISFGLYPNPPNWPISIFSGNSDKEILANLEKLYAGNWRRVVWGMWGYQVFDGRQRLLLGEFTQSQKGQVQVAQGLHWDFEGNTALLDTTQHFQVIRHGSISESDARDFITEAELNLKNLAEWLGEKEELSTKITCHFHASAEEKGLWMGNTQQSHAIPSERTVHTVLHPAYAGSRLGEENRIVLRELLGKPEVQALEDGITAKFAPKWYKKGVDYWSRQLLRSGDAPSLAQLLEVKNYQKSSPILRVANAYLLVEFLNETWGKERFLARYKNWRPNKAAVTMLDQEWQAFLASVMEEEHPQEEKKATTTLGYYRGFNFAHEGYRIYNGYGSELSRTSLDRLQKMNANAIAIVPYSYMENPAKPSPLRFVDWAGGETDESVIRTAHDATQRGMQALLKPQIWFGRGAWPGDVKMNSEEDWKLFFTYYGEWIRHYAILAEVYDIQLFCLGVEFAQATLLRADDWRELAQGVRQLYSGKLTYAANWGKEVEEFPLWDSFDCIGINCYYPLSKKDTVSQEELIQGFRATVNRLRPILSPYQKPILFTEIGFRSVEKSWQNPHAGSDGRAVSNEAQAQCYQAVCQVLAESDFSAGIFWWKWPSYLSYARRNPSSFSPSGQAAEGVIATWFLQAESKD